MMKLDVAKTLAAWAQRPLSVRLEYRPQSGKWSVAVSKPGPSSASLNANAEDTALDEAVREIARMIGGGVAS